MLLLSKFAASKVDVGGGDVNTGMQNTQSASAMLQLYTNVILQTPDIILPKQVDTDSKSNVCEDLPKHQKTARNNATDYLNTLNPQMVQTLSDIIGFHNLWAAEYEHLLQLANQIDQGNNADTFTQGIDNLIRKTQKNADATKPIIASLNDFLPKIQADARNFVADLQNVTKALSGEQGEIAQLKNTLGAINSAMSKDTTMIAGGAAGEVVGVLMITVGALAEFETGGLSTGLIVGGLAVMGGSSAVIGIAAKDLEAKRKEYMQLAAELATDQQILTLTTQASTHLTAMVDAVNNGIAAVQTLQKGWLSLQGDFKQVTDALRTADDPDLGSWLVDTLNSANKDWQDTYQLALHLQQTGVLPVKQGNSQSVFVAQAA